MNYIIGVDPGLSGAIAALGVRGIVLEVADMPIAKVKKGKNEIMAGPLAEILREYDAGEVWLESVHAMPGQGVSSSFSFGDSFGLVKGIAAALEMPLRLVTPQAWKKHHGLLRTDKDVSRTLASQLYPKVELHRKKDIGRADALLIARYGLDQTERDAS